MSFRNGVAYADSRRLPTPSSVYVRGLACHPLLPDLAEDLETRPRGVIAQCAEKRAMLESLLRCFQKYGARLVNSLEANAQHSQKPFQLTLLQSAGLPVPQWLATNNPEAVREFARHVRHAVYKPLAGGATVRKLEKRDLSTKRLSALAAAPVLFQELVEGTSIRAYVVGRRVVAAAAIDSTELDYRRKEDAVTPARLTPRERHAALTAARVCGMHFTGVDLIRSQKRFVVLECNPSPMFAVFEEKTGLDVAGPLADFLIRPRRRAS
ncbi:MAG: ATP-grasp domain-containing protein [Candidatus Hydrogenedentes bacterium]|nr:ATP-grasp domain-containing protein [Candidatus Hydrogenedentota bacterium]